MTTLCAAAAAAATDPELFSVLAGNTTFCCEDEFPAAAAAADAEAPDGVVCRGWGVVGSCGDCEMAVAVGGTRLAKAAGVRFTCDKYVGLLGLFFWRQSSQDTTSGSPL